MNFEQRFGKKSLDDVINHWNKLNESIEQLNYAMNDTNSTVVKATLKEKLGEVSRERQSMREGYVRIFQELRNLRKDFEEMQATFPVEDPFEKKVEATPLGEMFEE